MAPSLLLGIDQNASEMFWAVRSGMVVGSAPAAPTPTVRSVLGPRPLRRQPHADPEVAVTPRRLVVMPSRDYASSANVLFATPFASLPALRETLVPKLFAQRRQDAKELEEDRVSMEWLPGRGESPAGAKSHRLPQSGLSSRGK